MTFPLAISAKELGAEGVTSLSPLFWSCIILFFCKVTFLYIIQPTFNTLPCHLVYVLPNTKQKNTVFYQQTVVSTSLYTFSWHLWHYEERKKKSVLQLHVNKSLVFLFCLCKVGFKSQLSNQRLGLQCLVVQQLPL